MFAAMLGLGQFGGYVSAQHDLRLLFPGLCGHMESRFHALMALAAAVITVCVLITAICIREPLRPAAAEQEEQQVPTLARLTQVLARMLAYYLSPRHSMCHTYPHSLSSPPFLLSLRRSVSHPYPRSVSAPSRSVSHSTVGFLLPLSHSLFRPTVVHYLTRCSGRVESDACFTQSTAAGLRGGNRLVGAVPVPDIRVLLDGPRRVRRRCTVSGSTHILNQALAPCSLSPRRSVSHPYPRAAFPCLLLVALRLLLALYSKSLSFALFLNCSASQTCNLVTDYR